jgi:tetratricopeptide repeat protein
MRAFVVRPFGVQQGIDFDRVQQALIEPALQRLRALGTQIDGGTTGEITRAGNIREDMFRLLAVSDLVVADVTIHNANAFYELGVRHALRPEHTHLIRAKRSEYKYPFDLQTDRYFEYDLDNLGGDVEALAQALRATLAGQRDSPIFMLLKDLKPHERRDLVKIPDDFREDVERARKTARRGDLRLLAHECDSFEWDREGLALVGDAQFQVRAYAGAKDTFELLRIAAPNDYHANWRLGTIYQRLALATSGADKVELTTLSEQAIERALRVAENPAQHAELNALLGSNAKNRWVDDFRHDDAEQRGRRALDSPCLERMLECYLRAAASDLNQHYPSINALAFLKAQTLLARRFRDSWDGIHDTDSESELKRRDELADRIAANLRLSLRLDSVLKPFQSAADSWSSSSVADLTLLSDPTKTPVIAKRYREASAGTNRFALEANRRNLDLFKDLGLFEPGVSAAIKVVEEETLKHSGPERTLKRALLFTGHMVDAANRAPEQVRFPRTEQAEQIARRLIYDAVKQEVGSDADATVGIAGGACGSDILFHEVCAELGIRTELFLALPIAQFQSESVERGGERWVARFAKLCQAKSPRILQSSLAPPAWLAGNKRYSIWERNNLWMMFNTLATGAIDQALLALFNEEREAQGPGGTKHLLEVARKHGLRGIHLDARSLLK